ncbi:MAG: imidazole glycerol phosphate synthase subunit HisH [bacterium]
MIAVIDYGTGNLRSVTNAFVALEAQVCVCDCPKDLGEADKIVLPGVGAFGDAMQDLHQHGWVEALEENVRRKGKPFLGICLGLQVLAGVGTEHGTHQGLNWIPGVVEKIVSDDPDLRVPHIGWNDVRFARHEEGLSSGLYETETFYFMHSYVLKPDDPDVVKGVCDYGIEFAACVEKDNLWATQFHPEKSHKAGLAILRNFVNVRS